MAREKARLARYEEIADVLARHGLGVLASALGLDRWLRAPQGARGHDSARSAAPQHLRHALEELGPTFVKLGQLLSTRSDLLPASYVTELSRLQDDAAPVAPEQIREAIRQELGGEPDDVFASFDAVPLASASIGQAHAAELHDSTRVVVKVRRPDAVRRVHEDLAILLDLADHLSRMWEPARAYNVTGLMQEFSQTIRAELDYLREGRNAERFAANFQGRRDVAIPRVFWETTTSRVLTLERMSGIKIDDVAALDAAGIDRRTLAKTGTAIMLQMIFEDSFFHADPHPGNLFVRADGSIGLIDFGMVGELGDDLQQKLVAFLIAFTLRDPDALSRALIGLSVTRGSVDRERLHEAMVSFIGEYDGRSLSEVSFTHLATQLLAVLREQHLQLPREVALVFKVLIMIEGIGLRLDPDFDLNSVLGPYVRRLLSERLSLPSLVKRLARASADSSAVLWALPAQLRRLLETVDANGLEVHLRAAELQPLVARTERIGNRLVVGMIAAAFIRGVGDIVVSRRHWRPWEGAMVRAGLTALVSGGAYLVWTAKRRR